MKLTIETKGKEVNLKYEGNTLIITNVVEVETEESEEKGVPEKKKMKMQRFDINGTQAIKILNAPLVFQTEEEMVGVRTVVQRYILPIPSFTKTFFTETTYLYIESRDLFFLRDVKYYIQSQDDIGDVKNIHLDQLDKYVKGELE